VRAGKDASAVRDVGLQTQLNKVRCRWQCSRHSQQQQHMLRLEAARR
jgi:hypothetical protein